MKIKKYLERKSDNKMYILSVDLGTTSIKTAIVEENGNILGKSIINRRIYFINSFYIGG